MRSIDHSQTGAVSAKGILALAFLLLVAGGLLIMLFRHPPSESHKATPAAPVEMSRTNLQLTDGRLHVVGLDDPFTGIMLEHYPEGALRSRSVVSNGLLHGVSQGFYTNGQMQVEEPFDHGVSDGVRIKWYSDGTKQSEATIVQGQLSGSFLRWYTNGTLSERAQFINGQPDGESFAYYPSGYLKAHVVMKDGKMVEQKHWQDGEQKP